MLVDKKGLFKEFDVVVNGKFVALLVAPYERYRQGVNKFEFYFGVYNHKYFSMSPKFSLDCYMSCGSSEDFRLATDGEKKEFFEECRAFGYDWDIENHHFHHYNGVPCVLETKKQFLDMKLPKYIPLSKIGGHMVMDTIKFNNEHKDMFFILENNCYSHVKTRYIIEDRNYSSVDFLRYELEESFDGQHLFDVYMGVDKFIMSFTMLKDDALIFGKARMCWWFFANKFFDFPLPYSTDNKPNDYSKLTPEHLSEFGKMMIEQKWIDERIIFQLAREYMQYGWFSSLCTEIANIRRIEIESKKNSQFEL